MPYEGTLKLPEATATKEIERALTASGKSNKEIEEMIPHEKQAEKSSRSCMFWCLNK